MKKILPSNAKTKKYLDSLPKLYLVAFWAKWGTREYPFSGKYDKDGLTPLVWDYYDFNGEKDEYHLVPITRTTTGAIACWVTRKMAAVLIADGLRALDKEYRNGKL